MRYALAISATEDEFAAAYVSIYSFKKYHPDALVYFFGDKPDTILNTLNVYPVVLDSTNVPVPKNKLYTNNLVIALSNQCDAFVVAKCDVLYNSNLDDLINYAVQSKHVVGSTKIADNKLVMDSSLYIVPSNAINSKIKKTVFSGIARTNEEAVLVDAYYPILIDITKPITLTIEPGVNVERTDKRIIHYTNDAWKSTSANDLWTKVGEELIENLGK